MNKYVDESSRQTAQMNRERLAPVERSAILVENEQKAADVRMNMARLREQRLAKEAETVRTRDRNRESGREGQTKKAIQ